MIVTFSIEHNRFSNIEHLEKELFVLAENLLMICSWILYLWTKYEADRPVTLENLHRICCQIMREN
jgi:hypothetical protein